MPLSWAIYGPRLSLWGYSSSSFSGGPSVGEFYPTLVEDANRGGGLV